MKGRAQARLVMPDLPAECRRHMERVSPAIGEKYRYTQARWEISADAIDRQIDDCAAFHNDWKNRVGG